MGVMFHPRQALAAAFRQYVVQLLIELFRYPGIHGDPHHRLHQHPTGFRAIGRQGWGQTKGVKKAEIQHHIVIDMVCQSDVNVLRYPFRGYGKLKPDGAFGFCHDYPATGNIPMLH